MAENSGIAWTDATVNFWWGCTKVGPGCDHCYAEAWDGRFGGDHWGAGVPRKKLKSAVNLSHRLDNAYADWAADATCANGNAAAFGLPIPNFWTTRRVFIQSMSDLFDLEVPAEWFSEAWTNIVVCDRIEIQIVTKRLPAVARRLAEVGCAAWPKHAGLIATVCTQAECDRDLPRLIALKREFGIPWVGLSIEPQTEAVTPHDPECLDWVITGGESDQRGAKARPYDPSWARWIIANGIAADYAVFVKQMGSNPVGMKLRDRAGADLSEWPEDLRVRQFPYLRKALGEPTP